MQEMDSGIQCSDAILGGQLLQHCHSGLSRIEMQMIRTVCNNGLSDTAKLNNALREQFGQVHEKESKGSGKGKGYGQFEGRDNGRYESPSKICNHRSSYMVEEPEIEEEVAWVLGTGHRHSGL